MGGPQIGARCALLPDHRGAYTYTDAVRTTDTFDKMFNNQSVAWKSSGIIPMAASSSSPFRLQLFLCQPLCMSSDYFEAVNVLYHHPQPATTTAYLLRNCPMISPAWRALPSSSVVDDGCIHAPLSRPSHDPTLSGICPSRQLIKAGQHAHIFIWRSFLEEESLNRYCRPATFFGAAG